MFKAGGERGMAVSRAAGCMLRTISTTSVTLRYAARVQSGNARQLGLAAPDSEDVEIGPALVRELEAENGTRVGEVVVGAETIAKEMERRSAESEVALFAEVLGVVRDEVLWRLRAVTPMEFAGMKYLYRLKVAE